MHASPETKTADPLSVYRLSALPACTSCKTPIDERGLLSPSTGNAVCPRCFHEEALGAAEQTLEMEGRLDFVDERRCRCGGVASAEGSIVHETRVVHSVGLIALSQSHVQNGAETVFRCVSCGDMFALFNRVRVIRTAWSGVPALFLGGLFGVLLLGLFQNRLGWVGFFGAPPAMLLLTWLPLFRDIRTRLAHPAADGHAATRSFGGDKRF